MHQNNGGSMWRKLLLTGLVLTFAFSLGLAADAKQMTPLDQALTKFDNGQTLTPTEKALISPELALREAALQTRLQQETRLNYSSTSNLRSVLAEGFEDVFPPAGWSIINDGDANGWVLVTSGGHDAPKAAKISYGSTAHDDWLVTPELEVVSGDSIVLWSKNGSSFYTEEFNVMLSTTGNAKADFVVTLAANVAPGASYERLAYDLTTYAGSTVYVAFQAISTDQMSLYIDDVSGPEIYVPPVPPVASINPLPADAATGVGLDQVLSWGASFGATGYDLSFGTDNPPTNVLDAADQGDVLTYTPRLDYSTTYYWEVTPYNAYGDATGTVVWSFTTMDDPAIVAFPHVEDFEGSFPPAGWMVVNNNADGDTWIKGTSSSYAHGGSGSAQIYTDYNTANDDWLITPAIDLSGDAKRMKFWVRSRSTGEPEEMQVLLSTATSALADFTVTLMPSTALNFNTHTEFTLDLSDHVGGNVYIAFVRNQEPADGYYLNLDDVSIEDIPLTGEMVLAPASIDEEVIIGETVDATLTISNDGAGVLTVASIVAEEYVPGSNLFTEDFEGAESDWIVLDGNGDGDMWETSNTSYPYAGLESALINTDYNYGANDDYLISPLVSLTGNEILKFWSRVRSSSEPNDFEVLLSTTGTNVADFTNVVLPLASYSNTSYEEQTVDLSAYSGDVYLAFHIPAGGLDGWMLMIDNVAVQTLGVWNTASWIAVTPSTVTVAAGDYSDITVSLTAPADEGYNAARLVITSDDLGVADTETTVDVTMDAIGPMAPDGLMAASWDGAVELMWDDPNAMVPRSLEATSFETLEKEARRLEGKADLTLEDKQLLDRFHEASLDLNNLMGSDSENETMSPVLLRSFSGYNVYRRIDGDTDWGTALATGLPGFSYLDEAVVNGTIYEYAMTAVYTAGESALSDSLQALPRGIAALPYNSDFEADNGGMVTYDSDGYNSGSNDWEWGTPSYSWTDGPDTTGSGINVWGTNLYGDMDSYTTFVLLAPPVDLSGAVNGGVISFNLWRDIYSSVSTYYNLEVAVDHDNDGEFISIAGYSGSVPEWEMVSALIPDSLCSDYAQIAFIAYSGYGYPGAYIDDLYIDAFVPPVLAITPTSLASTLYAAESETQMLNLANTGGFMLDYDLEILLPPSSPSVLLNEDFEAGLGGLTDESAGAWALSTTLFHGGLQSVFDAYGTYADDILAVTDPIDLTGVAEAELSFWQIPFLEGGSYDNGFVEISSDGGSTWDELGSYNKNNCVVVPSSSSVVPTNADWIYSTLDLSAYSNQVVMIRFRLDSDSSVQYAGWYLDDIKVQFSSSWLSVTSPLTGMIPVGDNTDLDVLFNSTGFAIGTHEADIVVHSNTVAMTDTVHAVLTVEAAIVPTLAVNPDSVGFGNAFIEEPLPAVQVSMTNVGLGTSMDIISVVLGGTDADQFALTDANTYPVTLTGEAELLVDVAFLPTTEGDKSALLIVTDGVTREVHEYPLTGSADFLPFGNAPQALTATATDATVDLAWVAPFVAPAGYLTGFEDEVFPPTGWSQITLNTAATWDQTGYVNEDIDFANSGMYGAAIPWDYADQDEWLIVENVVVPVAGELSFWSYVFEGSTEGDHYNVNISTDDGATWTTVWDASALTLNDMNIYDYPYAIDLATYAGQTVDIAWQAVATGGLWYVWGIDDVALAGADGVTLSFSTGARSNQVHPLASRAEAERLDMLKDGALDDSGLFALMQSSQNGSQIRRSGGYRSAVSTSSSFRDLTGYNIFRAVEDGELEFLATTTEVAYTDLAVENGMTYVYAVTALYDEGESVPSNMVAATPMAVASMSYFSDFEADNGGFYGDGEWQWGAPTFSSGPDTAYSGLNVWGTVLDGNYTEYVDSWLIQPFDLTGATGTVVVSFKLWYITESCCDEGLFAIDHDNDGVYTVLGEVKGNSNGWIDQTIIIPDSLVSSYAKLALILTPDVSINYAGVYIDDFSVDDVLLPELALAVEDDFGVNLAYGEMAGSDDFTLLNTGVADLDYTLQYEAATGRVSGMREISGAYAYSTTWPVTPGTTFNMSIYVQNASTDVEWVDSASVTFPVGVTINEMTPLLKINSTSGLAASGISDDGLYAGWGSAGGPANIYSTSLAMATINVTIDAGFTGDLSFDWFINGEIYGSEPHTASGTFVFMAPDVEIAVTPMGGTIAPAGSMQITSAVTVNNYEVGFYPGFIMYTSNDPLNSEGWIPFNVNLAPASGTLAGMITSSYDNSAMADVNIVAVETTTLQEHVGLSGADGSYAMVLPVGNYDISMAYDEYDAEVANVDITLNGTTTLDMAMSPNVEAPIDLVAEEVEGGFVHLSWNMPGPETQLIAYHDGSGASSFYQNLGQGYGVVFDISAYTDATIEMADFVHYGWGLPGLFNYNLHIIDWTDFSTVNVITGLSTSADAAAAPQLEEGIDLGGLSGLTLVGIFIEPLSGAADDAYPGVMTDATAPALAGSSYIIDMAAIDASYDVAVQNPTSGDFMVNLWIHNPDGTVAQAPAIGDGRTIHESTPSLRTDATKEAVTGWPTMGLPVSDSALRSELLFFKVYSSVDAAEWTMIGASNSQDYTDESALASQSIEYKVTAQYDIAESEYSNVVQIQVVGVDKLGLPDTYALEQNYPNPFNPITFINYQLPEATNVKIMIYNVLGQKVATLIDQPMNAGYYSVSWSGSNQFGSPVSSGVYLYRIETSGFSAVRKLMYLK